VKEKFKDRIKEIDQNVKQLEQEHCFNELYFATTKSEIAKAIAQVKANKSPGVDCISNSMIQNSTSSILSCFSKLFNACLNYGIYHEKWAEGYIIPLHKGNDIYDPGNYS
jgi:hypothetical protein